MQRKSNRFPSISRLHFGCCLALPLHPSHGLFSLKLFHFTNICWQRGIANLSRAFFQISLLRQNADLSYCRCSHVFPFFQFLVYFLMDCGEKKNLLPTVHSITNVLILRSHKQILMASVIISVDCCLLSMTVPIITFCEGNACGLRTHAGMTT